ncbi:MAG: NADH:ubiquinone reductase (Na(+)-transporting) subunit A [Lewinella sp.]|nr:NADH:ubiquinone reductase (Na(+)-transporting) subunit A [Lewinella sp.]
MGITQPSKRVFWALLFLSAPLFQAQAASSTGNLLFYGLAALATLLLFFFIISVADNVMVIESRQTGADRSGANFGLFPQLREIVGSKMPAYLKKQQVYRLSKGYDIPLEGSAASTVQVGTGITRYAMQPSNFLGLLPIPKMLVEVGQSVKAGDPLFFDKKMERVMFAAPVSGEIIAIERGAKRSIANIIILADREQQSRQYTLPAPNAGRSELVDFLLQSGVWPFIRQRPYNVVADANVIPRDIFISTFDTAPLAPDLALAVAGRAEAFQKGLDVLNRLTDGVVYLGLDGRGDTAPSAVFTEAQGVVKRYFRGAHPTGNVGVQIHHIHPVSNQERVWTLDVHAVLVVGELFLTGKYDTARPVALTGAVLAQPSYVRTYPGANLSELLKGQLDKAEGEIRVISGDVLTGQQAAAECF